MSRPLEGIKIIDMSNYVAAPSCGRILADMGADVIKVEAIGGDPWRLLFSTILPNYSLEESPAFDQYNLGKRSICINAKSEDGHALILRMLETADVFITNTRLKALKRLGLDPDTLCAAYPRLIHAMVDAYGDKGEWADDMGFDNMAYWVKCGFVADMVYTECPYPTNVPSSVGDSATGMALAMQINAALYQRTVTGQGCSVKSSLYGVGIWQMGTMITHATERYGNVTPVSRFARSPLHSRYKCADGEWFTMAMRDYAKHSHPVFSALGVEEEMQALGITDAAGVDAHKSEMFELLDAAFLKKTADEWEAMFKPLGLDGARCRHFSDISKEPQAWVNGFLETVPMKDGINVPMAAPPVKMSSYQREAPQRVDQPGEHTDEILAEYGYSPEEAAALRASGAVG